jgi:hypothetical protein
MLSEGIVEESITFENSARQRLEYVLCTGPDLLAISASFEDGGIIVRMPNALMHQWGETDQVGIEGIQVGSDGQGLKILLEKDFECVDATIAESQKDAFPNPQFGGCAPVGTIERLA